MLKYKAIKKRELDEDKILAYQDFDLVLARLKSEAPQKKKTIFRTLISSNWSIAACIIVMISTLSYAVYVLLPANVKEIVKNTIKLQPTEDPNQRFEIPYNEDVEIITQDSIKLEISEYSLQATDPKTGMAIISISPLYLENKEVKKLIGKSISFYIDFKDNLRQNITVSLMNIKAEKFDCYYGGLGKKGANWNTFAPTNFIYKPTKEMQKYQDYVMAKNLIDTIKQNYTLSGNAYRSKNSDAFTYQKPFIDGMVKKVADYKYQKNALLIMSKAKGEWKKFHAQQIKIGYDVKEHAKPISFEINKAGWYKVVVLR